MGEGCCGGHCGCDHEKMDEKCECGKEGCDCKDGCECGKEGCDCSEMSTADLAESNNIIISALIEVLIRKGVVNQAELDTEIDSIAAEEDEDDEDEETPAEEATSAQ